MDCSILSQIKTAFNALWTCEPIDDSTIRVTVPYASINNKYVVLFIKEQKPKNRPVELVVTDGGSLHELLVSGDLGTPQKSVFDAIVDEYVGSYEIEAKENGAGVMYFKKTEVMELLPNCVFEMADFARSYLSAIQIGCATSEESEPDLVKDVFIRNAKKYLKSNYKKKNQLQFEQVIGPEGRKKKVSAIIYSEQKLNPVQFLSGSKFFYYKSNINNAHEDYKLLGDFDLIGKRLALYDDISPIYREEQSQIHEYLGLMREAVLTHDPIPWSKKELLTELVPV